MSGDRNLLQSPLLTDVKVFQKESISSSQVPSPLTFCYNENSSNGNQHSNTTIIPIPSNNASSSKTPPSPQSVTVTTASSQKNPTSKFPKDISYMFETFNQFGSTDSKPTYINPFQVRHRKKTSKEQFQILEETFRKCQKPSLEVRKDLATKLSMTPRSVQVWFQNRRAKSKNQDDIKGTYIIQFYGSNDIKIF